MKTDVDDLLGPVAEACRGAADDILDLREALMKRSDPGSCLQCYFNIFGVMKEPDPKAIDQLRSWLESHLEIVACDETEHELERLPISLHQPDMESFCREVMSEFQLNRNYQTASIELSVDFTDRNIALTNE